MTKYNTLVPNTIKVISGPMIDILATDHKGDQQKLMVYPEDIDTLIEDLQKARRDDPKWVTLQLERLDHSLRFS